MEISYLCAARGQDVRAIMLSDLSDQGIYIQQIKTKKKQIKLWTPRLREAVDLAMKIRRPILARKKISSLFLIVNRFGSPYTDTGLKSIWRTNRSRIAAGKDLTIDWTYHDIKAKGISDFEGDKQAFSGHKSRLQMERYNRKAELVPTLDTPKPEG
ncbi:MAG: integrase [Proteobacteria bacterium]|nr:integrase [Pseudomonadota bacterium]